MDAALVSLKLILTGPNVFVVDFDNFVSKI